MKGDRGRLVRSGCTGVIGILPCMSSDDKDRCD